MEYYKEPTERVLNELDTTKKGLTGSQAKTRLDKYGPNELKKEKGISRIKIFLSQFTSPLVIILIVAVLFSFGIGEQKDAIVILIILVMNAVLGYFQEYKAEKAIEALKKMASLQATVIRDGKKQKVDAIDIVPGDIIILEAGTKIPADSRILESFNMETQEAPLTGESTPIQKTTDAIKKQVGVGDQTNMLFSGTVVTRGRGTGVVCGTGMATEIGKIAKLIQEGKRPPTPLQLKLAKFSKKLGIAIGVIVVLVFFLRLFKGTAVLESFRDSIALAVAAIPEGLPIVFTIVLAIGVKKMVSRNALIRKLPSVETLGSVTVICSDKTGTLTHNQMTVRKIYVDDQLYEVTGKGYGIKGDFLLHGKKFDVKKSKGLQKLLEIGLLNNDAKVNPKEVIGDPTEAALIVSAGKAGLGASMINKLPRIDEIGFTSERKMMSTIHKDSGRKIIYSKGAPDVILKKCKKILVNGKEKVLTPTQRKKILQTNNSFADEALRVLGFAYKKGTIENSLVFVGLQAMIDPPRKEAMEAIETCNKAGIRTIMITGDHKKTAVAIGKELGLTGRAVDGNELGKIKDLAKEVEKITIFARVNPEHKLKIVDALKKKGHIVAMTGDGVNDAPALKKADIGVAMGIAGTDVSKEASDMILTDDNFSSIVGAVEEGRSIYNNIKKFIIYLLSSNLGEILTIFIGVLIGLPLPILALQILWINLATDGLPALALSLEPKEKDIMDRKPRDPKEHIISKYNAGRMLYLGSIMMIGTLGLFYWALTKSGYVIGGEIGQAGYMYATTVAFTTLMLFQMFNVLNCRSEDSSLFKIGIFSNKYMIGAIAISLVLQIAVLYTPLSFWFRTVPLSFMDWVLIIAVGFSVILFNEIDKGVRLYLGKKASS